MSNDNLMLLKLQAEDADKTSRIVYSIVDDSVKDQFNIDRNDGEITILNKGGLWRLNNSDTVTFLITVSNVLKLMYLNIIRMLNTKAISMDNQFSSLSRS